MSNLRILVIDDKKIIGDLFELTLGSEGHVITWEKDGNIACELMRESVFDVVFLDIVMPDDDGVAVLQKIKDEYPDIPVIMMTGYALEDKKHQAMILGAGAILKKPFNIDELRQALKVAMEEC